MAAEKQHLPERKKKEEVAVERTRSRKIYTPPVDIYEQDKGLVLVADLPGVDEKTLSLTPKRGLLTIEGRAAEPEGEGYTLGYHEYHIGDYQRSFELSEEVDQTKIEAEIKNGVLRVYLPLSEKAQPKTAKIGKGVGIQLTIVLCATLHASTQQLVGKAA